MDEIKLSPELVEHIRLEIVPEIEGAARDSLAAFEQGRTETGENNFTNYSLGCSCWDNAFNRLERKLGASDFFAVRVCRKIMEITAPNGEENIIFYISRVDRLTRIPKAGKSIKRIMQEQLFLSDELMVMLARIGVYTLGYDIDPIQGLGNITFDLLTPVTGHKFQNQTLHTFRPRREGFSTERPLLRPIPGSLPVPEAIPGAAVSRKPSQKRAIH